MRVVAIDPGANGGVACISSEGISNKLVLHSVVDMPNLDTAKGLHDLMVLMHWADCGGKVVIELQRGRSGNSVKGTWNHARHYGKLEVCLSLVGASTHLVQPSVWMGKVKKVVGDPVVTGMKDTKARTWTLANQLFPDAVMCGPRGRKKDGLADAVCLGWYYLLHVHK
jgi:hypothetical protein